jgi:hypothetical protein
MPAYYLGGPKRAAVPLVLANAHLGHGLAGLQQDVHRATTAARCESLGGYSKVADSLKNGQRWLLSSGRKKSLC